MTSSPRVVASVEARMGSSRLPGKVLADIGGRPALGRLFDRLRRARLVDATVLATTDRASDDPLARWAEGEGLEVFRGSEDDVLERVVGAHVHMGSDIIVEVTGDCPLIDPEVIDLGVDTFLSNECDVVANVVRPCFPQGVDVQVFRRRTLERVAETVFDPAVREHVSLHFYENPKDFGILHLRAPRRYHGPNYRFQLDHPEDLEFQRAVWAALEPVHGVAFGTPEVLALLAARPDIARLNAACEEKPAR